MFEFLFSYGLIEFDIKHEPAIRPILTGLCINSLIMSLILVGDTANRVAIKFLDLIH